MRQSRNECYVIIIIIIILVVVVVVIIINIVIVFIVVVVVFIGFDGGIDQNIKLSGELRLLVPSCITSNRKLKLEVAGHRPR